MKVTRCKLSQIQVLVTSFMHWRMGWMAAYRFTTYSLTFGPGSLEPR